MLAKGEVKELIVRPEYDIVTIVLHEGAVVKGKRSLYRSYHMVVPNSGKLEEKVREAEKSLGIKPGKVTINKKKNISIKSLAILSFFFFVQ